LPRHQPENLDFRAGYYAERAMQVDF
jgi:hypothetical protein